MYPSLVTFFASVIFSSELCFGNTEEAAFIASIKKFLGDEEDILKKLKEFKNGIEEMHNQTIDGQNAFDEFSIVKRLVIDWHFITALASVNKRKFLSEIQEDVSIIQDHSDFATLGNLADAVLKIAEAQEKQGIQSVREFVMTLTNDPYTKLTASECSVFAEVLTEVNKDTLAKRWEMESQTLQDLNEDPLMEIYEY